MPLFGLSLYQQIVGISMRTNCAPLPLIAALFMFCYERDFMSLFHENQANIIEAFNSSFDIWMTY